MLWGVIPQTQPLGLIASCQSYEILHNNQLTFSLLGQLYWHFTKLKFNAIQGMSSQESSSMQGDLFSNQLQPFLQFSNQLQPCGFSVRAWVLLANWHIPLCQNLGLSLLEDEGFFSFLLLNNIFSKTYYCIYILRTLTNLCTSRLIFKALLVLRSDNPLRDLHPDWDRVYLWQSLWWWALIRATNDFMWVNSKDIQESTYTPLCLCLTAAFLMKLIAT